MTTLWSCPNPACPPTENAPREVEEPGEVARGVSERSLSISDLATLLKVPVSTIYSWNRQGAGPPHHKIGKSLRYRGSDVLRWSKENLVPKAVCAGECGQSYPRRKFTQVEGKS
jgi:predicted DNA-binding transcriptional regulator AlpA